MNLAQALGLVRQILSVASVIVALLLLAKLAGVGVPIRASLFDLAAVTIAAALAARA